MRELAATALLTFSVLGALLSALGIMSAATPFDRLHYVSVAAIVMPIPLALAIIVRNGIGAQISVETVLITVVLSAANPVATHAIARAFRVRETGDLRVRPEDEAMS